MIPLNLPDGAEVTGELLPSYTLPELDQDLLQVGLPDGTVIDVGWYPASDPNGCFKIHVYRTRWDNRLITPIESRDPHDIASVVERLAKQFSRVDSVPANDLPFETHLAK